MTHNWVLGDIQMPSGGTDAYRCEVSESCEDCGAVRRRTMEPGSIRLVADGELRVRE